MEIEYVGCRDLSIDLFMFGFIPCRNLRRTICVRLITLAAWEE